jgi:MoCo/4Fe-4S cofactor protein with predicted Tat translocation signal
MSAPEPPRVPVEFQGVRGRGHGARRRYWKSLDELAESPAFLELVHREFPEQAAQFEDPEGRREFLKVMGASLALAGLTACTRQPEERILPYVKQPEDVLPGRPLLFATAVTVGGYAQGVLVESHEGRPTKIEGNPDHPQSLGATDVFGQAHILDLYDPDRAQTLKFQGEVRAWSSFQEELKDALDKPKAVKGVGFRILSGLVTSPTLAAQLESLLADYPAAKWIQYEPAGRDNVRAGAELAFGQAVEPQYRFDKADVILSLDADFVGTSPTRLRLIREFAARRKASSSMNRLYVVEASVSATGAIADHRLPLKAADVEGVARAVAKGLGVAVEGAASSHAEFVKTLTDDLRRHGGASVVIAGDAQPPAVHALAHAMNQTLGNVGKTVVYTAPAEPRSQDQLAALEKLVTEMEKGRVDLLLVLGGNPVYDAPADLGLAADMEKNPLGKVALRVRLGLYEDETSERCHWQVPDTHALESWSDARAADGTVTILQPLIAPLYDGKSVHELIAACAGRPDRKGYEILRDHWKDKLPAGDPELAWKRMLHDGVVPGTAAPEKSVTVAAGEWLKASPPPAPEGLEIVFRPDSTVYDGRFANNGWLQELPKVLTKLTWENAALLSPKTAAKLGVRPSEQTPTGSVTDVVRLSYGGRSLDAAAWIVPGHADDSVTLHLGYGRTRAGRVGSGIGANAYLLRTSAALWHDGGLEVKPTGEKTSLACTQDHWSMEGRDIVRAATAAEYEKNPAVFSGAEHEALPSLYPPHKYEGHAWGMAIDLASCVACNACVVACQAENNIPVVGKDQVTRGRAMHWIRVDRYYEGDPQRSETIETHHQPLTCMHCENAPCEVVCPVAATVHSDEGLNDMVYNRCVGTRYCSNNCPYKVRRFNFFLYQDWTTETFKMMRNPDVTVRSRGVMEKCTYCVQRINRARIDARNESRPIKDGEIKTACQQVCPAEAIVFGDINDPQSVVSKWKADGRNYALLTDLNTKPRTSYLADLKNPNPETPRG